MKYVKGTKGEFSHRFSYLELTWRRQRAWTHRIRALEPVETWIRGFTMMALLHSRITCSILPWALPCLSVSRIATNWSMYKMGYQSFRLSLLDGATIYAQYSQQRSIIIVIFRYVATMSSIITRTSFPHNWEFPSSMPDRFRVTSNALLWAIRRYIGLLSFTHSLLWKTSHSYGIKNATLEPNPILSVFLREKIISGQAIFRDI